MFNINDWNWPDPQPDSALADIALASDRAMALLVRNRGRPTLQTHLMQIVGAIEMINGMEYHHDAFIRLHRRIARTGDAKDLHLRHEAIAYLNRLGQFVTFARSGFVKSVGVIAARDAPTLERAMIFRNKHAAHRSIDAPRGADTPALTHAHARALSNTFGSLFHPRPGKRPLDLTRLPKSLTVAYLRMRAWRAGFLVFQLQTDEEGGYLNFSLEEEHPVIMGEAYQVIERVIMAPAGDA
jgi:hypothetical protein